MNRSSIESLIKKFAKGGPTGMSDDVPAVINGVAPAALSQGEYVIPADVVSMIGEGSSEAGAKILDQLVKTIRQRKGKYLAKGKQAPRNA